MSITRLDFANSIQWLTQHEEPCVAVALSSGLFDFLNGQGPKSLQQLSNQLKWSMRGTRAVVGVLSGMGFLQYSQEKDAFDVTDESCTFLTSGSSHYWGPMILHRSVPVEILEEALKKEFRNEDHSSNATKAWLKGDLSHAHALSLCAAMHSHSLVPAACLAQNIDMTKEFGVTDLLDIGGGSGCYRYTFLTWYSTSNC